MRNVIASGIISTITGWLFCRLRRPQPPWSVPPLTLTSRPCGASSGKLGVGDLKGSATVADFRPRPGGGARLSAKGQD